MKLLVFASLFASACAFGADEATKLADPVKEGQAEAVFAGGCFWCIESDFEKLKGVVEAESGYTGGEKKGPSYKQVGYGMTSHLEGIRVVYDPKVVTYPELVNFFFRHVDPTQANGQFCDKGPHYRTAVFVADETQKKVAEAAVAEAGKVLGKPIVTEILPAKEFWLAEDYHQDFYIKEPAHYQRYRKGCGRDARVQELWGSSTH